MSPPPLLSGPQRPGTNGRWRCPKCVVSCILPAFASKNSRFGAESSKLYDFFGPFSRQSRLLQVQKGCVVPYAFPAFQRAVNSSRFLTIWCLCILYRNGLDHQTHVSSYQMYVYLNLVGALEHDFDFSIQLGRSSQLTNSLHHFSEG